MKISQNDLLVGVLILIAGIIYYEFTPAAAAPGAGKMFMAPPAHTTSHYIATVVAVLFGLVGLVLYKKVNKVTFAASAFSVVLGLVILLDAPSWPLYSVITPHPMAMANVAGLIMLIGLASIVGSVLLKTKA